MSEAMLLKNMERGIDVEKGKNEAKREHKIKGRYLIGSKT